MKPKKSIHSSKKNKTKSWDPVWEKIFSSREWGKYPPEELIRFTAQQFYKTTNRRKINFLDLGCGTGSCSWYLAKEGFTVYGVDGSKTAISQAKKRFQKENLTGNFKVMDYIHLDFPDNFFDSVIDVGSIQCNPIYNVPIILQEINRILKPSGKLFLLMSADGSYDGPFKGKGYNHFFKLQEIKKLFRNFKTLSIEQSTRTMNDRKNKIINWIVTCENR